MGDVGKIRQRELDREYLEGFSAPTGSSYKSIKESSVCAAGYGTFELECKCAVVQRAKREGRSAAPKSQSVIVQVDLRSDARSAEDIARATLGRYASIT